MTPRVVEFTVYGEALSQGSMKAIARTWRDKVTGERRTAAAVTHSNPELVTWREDIRAAIQLHAKDAFFPEDVPVKVDVTFYLARPKTLPQKIRKPVRQRDVDKLARAAADAMTGKLYKDDKQITDLRARKRFTTDRPKVVFRVSEDEEANEAASLSLPL